MQKIKRVMVTGSSGTIGTRLCEKLLEKSFDVVGVDIVSNKWNAKIQKRTLLVDLRNPVELKKLPSDVDLVIHLAANAKVFASVENPQLAFDNLIMTHNILEFCRQHKVKRFFFASSREVYGNTQQKIFREEDVHVANTESPYAASKLAGESLVHSYQKCFGIDFVIFRFSNVYGMYDNSERLVPQVIQRNLQNKDITVFGDQKALSFTYIDDAVDGVLQAIERFDTAKNECFNVAHPESKRIVEVVQLLQTTMNAQNKIVMDKTRVGEVERFAPDISKARRVLGFNPIYPLEKGIPLTVRWYLAHCYKK